MLFFSCQVQITMILLPIDPCSRTKPLYCRLYFHEFSIATLPFDDSAPTLSSVFREPKEACCLFFFSSFLSHPPVIRLQQLLHNVRIVDDDVTISISFQYSFKISIPNCTMISSLIIVERWAPSMAMVSYHSLTFSGGSHFSISGMPNDSYPHTAVTIALQYARLIRVVWFYQLFSLIGIDKMIFSARTWTSTSEFDRSVAGENRPITNVSNHPL